MAGRAPGATYYWTHRQMLRTACAPSYMGPCGLSLLPTPRYVKTGKPTRQAECCATSLLALAETSRFFANSASRQHDRDAPRTPITPGWLYRPIRHPADCDRQQSPRTQRNLPGREDPGTPGRRLGPLPRDGASEQSTASTRCICTSPTLSIGPRVASDTRRFSSRAHSSA